MTGKVARWLYRVDQARAQLTTMAAVSASLPQLHAYLRRLAAEQAVNKIRRQFGLPPPLSS